jgi:hypothetical protein
MVPPANQKEVEMAKYLNLLPLIVVIFVVKVKIIFRTPIIRKKR